MNDPDFDETVFLKLQTELGVGDTMEVLKAFLTDTEAKIERLRRDDIDRLVLKREAHSIKSSAATFGFRELSRHARELDAGAAFLSIELLRQAVLALSQTFEATSALAQVIVSNIETGVTS